MQVEYILFYCVESRPFCRYLLVGVMTSLASDMNLMCVNAFSTF